ncbi:diguanylate cyclase [Colwellia sp. MSW7]|uniref:diguanylate cyclase n=1 Tax=Colwellia maritima TaxID=2912588 RepID=A0ABS9X8F9_9GAMM|nr:sensor domain-containing diguanylate cyclase [Colwellia maritima]MCI2285347.1 diguanylate cyclase [Colwellia maritima]
MAITNHSTLSDEALRLQRQERRQQKRINRAAIGFVIFFVGWVVVILSTIFYKSSLDLSYVLGCISISFIVQIVLFYLFKTNKNLKFNDPNLTTLQLFNAIFWVSLAMILMPQIKGIIVFFSFVCLLYSVFHTSKLALYLLPVTSIIGLALADVSFYLKYPEDFSFQYEVIEFMVFSLSTVWISVIANFSSKLRTKLQQQRQEILKTNELLAIQSKHDALTGLKNRRYFDEQFTIEYKRASRNNNALSMIMIDLDNFKSINDLYGHDLGDGCLKYIANLLAEEVNRTGDILARYGGEEFVILLPNTSGEQAFKLALQLKDKINQCLYHYENSVDVNLKLTASFGVSCYNENNVTSQSELLITADKALYLSKSSGRNQVKMYHPNQVH